MSAKEFLQEASNFQEIRSKTWQGPGARSGRRYEKPAEEKKRAGETINDASGALWERLFLAAGGDDAALRAVGFMQRRLLEHVDNMPLDEIEMIAAE